MCLLTFSRSVTEVPADGPTWRSVLSVYHIDQQLHSHCHVFGSRPPASFSFFLNDHPVTVTTFPIFLCIANDAKI